MVDILIQNAAPLGGVAAIILASASLVKAFGQATAQIMLARRGRVLTKGLPASAPQLETPGMGDQQSVHAGKSGAVTRDSYS